MNPRWVTPKSGNATRKMIGRKNQLFTTLGRGERTTVCRSTRLPTPAYNVVQLRASRTIDHTHFEQYCQKYSGNIMDKRSGSGSRLVETSAVAAVHWQVDRPVQPRSWGRQYHQRRRRRRKSSSSSRRCPQWQGCPCALAFPAASRPRRPTSAAIAFLFQWRGRANEG